MRGEALAGQGRFTDSGSLLLHGYNGMKDDPDVLKSPDLRRQALERITKFGSAPRTSSMTASTRNGPHSGPYVRWASPATPTEPLGTR